MKNIVTLSILIFLISCTTAHKINYTTTLNGSEKILQGVIDRSLIESDSSFPWFKKNYKYAQPAPNAIEVFKNKKDQFSLMVFGGTWCEDTQNLLPLFYKLVDASEYPSKKLTLVGVNRAKQSGADSLSKIYHIINVPTFIILNKKREEVGRVVEYGKYNAIDKELGEIVEKMK
jgi:thiol-disulfide isomerase/thioredoxin